MGDCSSKEKNNQPLERFDDAPSANEHGNSAESEDSGIELQSADNGSERFSTNKHSSPATVKKSNFIGPNLNYKEIGSSSGGIAFELSLENGKNIKQAKYKYRQNLTDRSDFKKANKAHSSDALPPVEKILRKQAEADRRREASQLVIVARQKRRDLKATKVHEKRNRLHHTIDEDSIDDLSDVDQTFNTNYDIDWDGTSQTGGR